MKPIVYIASPYSNGDPCINTHFQVMEFNKFLDDGIITPYIPLTTHFLHTIQPRPYEEWLKYDTEMLRACDACLRLPAINATLDYHVTKSGGADREERWFMGNDVPVFYSKSELYKWVREVWNKQYNRDEYNKTRQRCNNCRGTGRIVVNKPNNVSILCAICHGTGKQP